MMDALVDYTVVEPGIALITIERADKMNALNEGVIQGLRAAWQRFADSDEKVAILAAAGERAFSVGADIKDAPREMWQGVPSVGVELYKPVIAAVHGWCIGGAYVIVQMCDLVVAAENTVFKYPEAQVGFTGGLIASAVARLPHKIAMEFMLLGEDLTAQRAYDVGMVNAVVAERDAARGGAALCADPRALGAARRRDAETVYARDNERESRGSRGARSQRTAARARQRRRRRRSARVR